MSEKLAPRHSAYTAKELVDCGWVARVRHAVGNGKTNVGISESCQILAQNVDRSGEWMPIMLPNGGTQLTDHVQALLVVEMLEGTVPIPSPTSPSTQ